MSIGSLLHINPIHGAFMGRHTPFTAWRPLSVPASWNCANSDDRRRDFRIDISAISRTTGLDYRRSAQLSLRAPLWRASAARVRLRANRRGASPAVNNGCWSYTLAFAHDSPGTGLFYKQRVRSIDRSVDRVTTRKSASARGRIALTTISPLDRYAALIFHTNTQCDRLNARARNDFTFFALPRGLRFADIPDFANIIVRRRIAIIRARALYKSIDENLCVLITQVLSELFLHFCNDKISPCVNMNFI